MAKLVRLEDYILLLYPLAVVFEFWKPVFLPNNISISFIIGILYLGITLSNAIKRINIISKERWMWFLLSYFFIELVMSLIHIRYATTIKDVLNYTVFFNILFLILVSGHLNQNEKLLHLFKFSFVMAVGLMGLLNMYDIGLELDKGRLQSFGEDANTVANKALFSILFGLFSIKFYSKRGLFWSNGILVVAIYLSLFILINTASRGPFITLMIILIASVLFSKLSIYLKVGIFLVLFTVGFNFFVLLDNSDLLLFQRLTLTIEENQTGRNEIWEAAFRAIIDNPFGVGKSGALATMEEYLGEPMGTHNIFLWFGLTSGFLGLSMFLIFNGFMLTKAYKMYKLGDNQFLLYFASITFITFQAGGIENKKFMWLIYTIILSAPVKRNKINVLK